MILRMLFIKDLRKLQTQIDEMIVQVQVCGASCIASFLCKFDVANLMHGHAHRRASLTCAHAWCEAILTECGMSTHAGVHCKSPCRFCPWTGGQLKPALTDLQSGCSTALQLQLCCVSKLLSPVCGLCMIHVKIQRVSCELLKLCTSTSGVIAAAE